MSDCWRIVRRIPSSDKVIAMTTDDDGVLYYSVGRALWSIKPHQKLPSRLSFSHSFGAYWIGMVCDKSARSIYLCDLDSRKVSVLLKWNLNYHMNEVAGNGEQGREDGEARNARFGRLQQIAVDKFGDIYVTDRNHIRKIRGKRIQVVETIAGCYSQKRHEDGEAKHAVFSRPTGIVVSEDDTINVCDTNNHCIRQMKDGMVSTVAGTPEVEGYRDGKLTEAFFSLPYSLVLDGDGTLLVCSESARDCAVRRIDLVKNIVSTLTIPGGKPWCLAKHKEYLYVGYEDCILQLENTWKWERFLWLGHLKEKSSYCHLARMPKDLVKEIASWFVTPLQVEEEDTESKCAEQ